MKISSFLRHVFVFVFVLQSITLSFAAPATAAKPSAIEDSQKIVRISVHFQAPDAGFASLALYDDHGVLTRSLANALPVTAGDHELIWDGTTDLGLPAIAGQFTARGIFFKKGPEASFVMKVGKSGTPPYRTPDGRGDWGANLGGPCAMCANSASLMMGWSCVEDGQITGIQQTDINGNIMLRYFSFYPWDGRFAGAMDDKNFYLGILNADKKRLEIAEYKLGEPRGRILTPLPTKPHVEKSDTRWNGRFTASLDGLAITGASIYATIAADDALFIINRASGQIRRQVSLPSPRGVVIVGEKVFVVSEKQILVLHTDGERGAIFAKSGVLDAPGALAADKEGNVFAAGGNGQVCVFAPDGKLIQRIGKAGGAPASGRFDSAGIGAVAALCIGPDHNLWIHDTATGFQRVSRWSTTTGALQQEWFNHAISLSSEVMNPAAPDELINLSGPFSDNPGITTYTVNLAAGTWKPGWHYDVTLNDMYFAEDTFRSFAHGGNPFNGIRGPDTRWPVFGYESRHPVTGPNGLKYFMNESSNGEGAMFVYDARHKPRPVALLGYHHCNRDATTGKVEDFYRGGPNNWFAWADRNGDGKASADEIAYSENPKMLERTSYVADAVLDEGLNVRLSMQGTDAADKPCLINKVLPPKEILASGAVIYDWSMIRDAVSLAPPDLVGGDGAKKISGYAIQFSRETKDASYALVEAQSEKPLDLAGIDGPTWWASRNWRTKLARFDKQTGKCLWAVGRRASAVAKPGEMYHPSYLAGIAGDALFVTDTLGPLWVWTTDGLYLGHIYNDHVTGVEDANTIYGETQQTEIYSDPISGSIYSIANDTAASVHKVTLPKTVNVEASRVTLTIAQVAAVLPWDPDGVVPTDRPRFEVGYTSKPPKINDNMDRDPAWADVPDQPKRQRMQILLDGGAVAYMHAMYDDQNLYLAYEVLGKIPAENSGSELPYAPFVSGAYVDFTVAPDWTGPRREVCEGDVRVIIARIKDGGGWKTFKQGFWEVKANGSEPHTIKSPAASVKFDQIAAVPGLQCAYLFSKDDPKGNYLVQVAIPLASIGIVRANGKTIGFDASIGIGNAAGDHRERAAHWGGRTEAAVVDRPGSAALLPDTWGTMTFLPH